MQKNNKTVKCDPNSDIKKNHPYIYGPIFFCQQNKNKNKTANNERNIPFTFK